MSHLSLEALARLVDEAPAPDEAAHLAVCATCALEREAMQEQRRELAALPPVPPPATGWVRVEARLHRERLLRAPTAPWGLRFPGLLRLAAALAIFVLGGITGAALGGAGTPGTDGPRLSAARPDGGMEPGGASLTAEETARALRDAEAAYLSALSQYAGFASPSETTELLAPRLAALESIVLTTRAALSQAPADPVINGYHLTALAQREATLRQVSAAADEPWF